MTLRRLDAKIFSTEVLCCLTAGEWREAQRHLRITKNQEPFIKSAAMTHTFAQPGGAKVFVVCFNQLWVAGWTLPELIGALAHEATHVWQGIKEQINEPNPSHEVEACTVQWITQWLAEQVQSVDQLGDPTLEPAI